jgi:formylglycine-generating enzyme required for sulfatase activity
MSSLRLRMGALGVLLAATLSACSPQPISPDANPALPAAFPLRDKGVQVLVPSGKFEMGDARYRDEVPAHSVEIDRFWIDRTEVTNAQYALCVDQGICQPPIRFNSYSRPDYYGNPLYGAYPVIYVNWDDADTFCRWEGRRLPTEAEWERAARGNDERIYPWGNELPDPSLLNFDFTIGDTSVVGGHPAGASPYGVLDMAGNVEEWVADWYAKDYYSQSARSDPGGPLNTGLRVVRGGSWLDNRYFVRSGLRLFYPPDSAFIDLGFRCAESVSAPPLFMAGVSRHMLH